MQIGKIITIGDISAEIILSNNDINIAKKLNIIKYIELLLLPNIILHINGDVTDNIIDNVTITLKIFRV